VQANTTNIGPVAAIASSNTQINLTGFAPTNHAVPILNAAQSDSYSRSYTCTSPGILTLNVSVDADGAVVELSENNNFFTTQITCTEAPKPDYVPQASAPASAAVNSAFSLVFSTLNNGSGAAANNSITRVSFPSNPTTNWNIAPLAPGASSTFATNLVCPATAGIYSINVTVDANNNVQNEIYEGNNELLLPINCTPPALPNYVPRASAPSGVFTNNLFTVAVNTSNIGTAPGGAASTTRVSFPGNPSANIPVPSLQAGQAQSNTVTFNCSVPGINVLNITVDAPPSAITESNESDNELLLQIGCSNQPDYTAEGSAPASVPLGSQFSYVFHTRNTGAGNAANSTTTRVSFPGNADFNYRVGPLAAGATNTYGGSFNCSVPGGNTLTIAADANNEENDELSESNNNRTLVVNCTTPALSCGFRSHPSSVFFPGESAILEANCTIGGASANCPALNFTTNITQGSLNPSQAPAGASPRTSNFSIAASAPTPQMGAVQAVCANSSQCNLSCSLPVELLQIPNSCNLFIVNHSTGSMFTPTDWSLVQANCSRITTSGGGGGGGGGGIGTIGSSHNSLSQGAILFSDYPGSGGTTTTVTPTACPDLLWSTTITHSTLDPANTPAQRGPLTNFSTANSPPQNGTISAASTLPLVSGLSCSIPVSVGPVGPDYYSDARSDQLIYNINEVFAVHATVTNIGNMGTNTTTITRFGGNCTLDERSTPGLSPGQSVNYTFTCRCAIPNRNTLYVAADANDLVRETNENNNVAVLVFYCGASYAPVCSDYV